MPSLKLSFMGLVVIAVGCSPAPRPASQATNSNLQWREFTADEDGYRVKMPGQPKRQERDGYVIRQVILTDPQAAYTVHHGSAPAAFAGISAELKLRSYEQRTIKKEFPTGKLVEVKDITLGEHPGKEFVLVVDGYDLIRRVYFVNSDMYMVTVSGSNLTPTSPHVVPFFDSFTLK